MDPLARALDVEFWTVEEQRAVRQRLLERFREEAVAGGAELTAGGLGAAPARVSTRGLEKEMRRSQREISILADLVRHLLHVSVVHGGCRPEELLEFLGRGPDRDEVDGTEA